ncbi:hypothetical protein [Cronobacter malonaticus]|uniref:hypothetical protein n=1 Tax=Cronobacter malonaticus TaxID=413503 RepID=UPI0012D326EC|nr:hypothetical protein [Cronobacter malonaticus]
MVGALRLPTLQKTPLFTLAMTAWWVRFAYPPYKKTPIFTLAMTAWWVRFAYPPYKKHLSSPWR